MKKSLFVVIMSIVFAVAGHGDLFGQSYPVNVTVIKKPPHKIRFDSEEDFLDQVIVSFVNTSSSTVSFNLNFDANGPRGLTVHAKELLNDPIVLNTGEALTITGNDFEEYGLKNFSEDIVQPAEERNRLKLERVFREGNYTFCLTAIDPVNPEVFLSDPNEGCDEFEIVYGEAPMVIMPADGDRINPADPAVMNVAWTHNCTGAPVSYDYTIKIIDITAYGDSYDPVELMEQPGIPVVVEDEVSGVLSTAFTDIDLEDNHRYALRVTAVDQDEDMLFEHGGKSDVVVFDYKAEEMADEGDGTCACSGSATPPELSVSRPDAAGFPLKYAVSGIGEYALYLFDCNDHFSSLTHEIATAVDWEGGAVVNAIEHEYENPESVASEVCVTFTITPKPGMGGVAGCQKTVCVTIPEEPEDVEDAVAADLSVGDTIYAGANGEFPVILTQITSPVTAKYTGKGRVFIDWLQARVDVSFDKISLDEDNHLIAGVITADIAAGAPSNYPVAWGIEAAASNTWTNSAVGAIRDWVKGTTGQTIPFRNPNKWTTPVSMPLGVSFGDDNQFMMTEMVFEKDQSKINIVAAKSTPASWGEEHTLGFKASNLKFHPSNFEVTQGRMELVADLSVDVYDNKMNFTFKAPASGNSGCYVEWDEDGFSLFGLEVETALSRDWFVPLPDDGASKTKIRLAGQGNDWDELILTGNLQKSEITGTGGLVVKADNISYDMSDVLNPIGMQFPANYSGVTDNFFRGFFAKNIELELPEAWETGSGEKMKINVQNMIIDNLGLSMNVQVNNVFQFNEISVVDLAASVDLVEVEVQSNSLTKASIAGKLALPVTKTTNIDDNSLVRYSASLHVVQKDQETEDNRTHFEIVINPTELQKINFALIHADLTLKNTSKISAYLDDNKKTFSVLLNGEVDVKGVDVGPLSLNSLGMRVEGFKFDYNSKGFVVAGSGSNDKTDLDIGHWALASPQKTLNSRYGSGGSAFSLSFRNVSFSKGTAGENEYLRGDVKFGVRVVLAGNISGTTYFKVHTAIEKGSGLTKFKPKYKGVDIDSIAVSADLKVVAIEGSIAIRNNDPTYGDGFLGYLSADFKVPKVHAYALAEFGNVNSYKYWRVQAGARFDVPVPLGGAIAFYGFGGGAYHNMRSVKNSNSNAPLSQRYLFYPQKNINGFNVAATIGAAKVETFNSDVEISAEFGSGDDGGIRNIRFNGDFWIGANVTTQSRNEATVKGKVAVEYDFPNKIFDLNADVSVNKAPITTPAPANFKVYVNGKSGKWYVKFGDSYNPNMVQVDLGIYKPSVYSYMMFGNDIPMPTAFTTRFANGYKSALGHFPGFTPTTDATAPGSNAQNGSGIALGIGFDFQAGGYQYVCCGYYAGIGGRAGAEMNLSLLEYPHLRSLGKGLNGWQAGGSIGFYASVAAGAYKKSGNTYTKKFTVAEFSGGGYVTGRFPNPVWLTGEVSGRVKVGCCCDYCLINCGASVDFEYGENINPGEPATDIKEAQEQTNFIEVKDQVVEDMEKHIVRYIHPENYSAFPIDAPIAVKYNVPPNAPFEIEALDGEVRVFKFITEVHLSEENPLSCTEYLLNMNVQVNGEGEYLYTANTKLNTAVPSEVTEATAVETGSVTDITANSDIYNIGVSTGASYWNGFGTQTTVRKNNLSPHTYYKFWISTFLREYIDGQWEPVRFNGEYVEEVVEVGFLTVDDYQTVELAQCDAMYHEMTLTEFMNLSQEEREQYVSPDGKTYISVDGNCTCPHISAEEMEQNEEMRLAMEAAGEKIGKAFNPMTPDQLDALLAGFPSNSGYGTDFSTDDFGWDGMSVGSVGSEVSSGAAGVGTSGVSATGEVGSITAGAGVYTGGFNAGSFNNTANGSFGGFNGMAGSFGGGFGGH